MKPKGLTARQQQFCVSWLVHSDATKAYREAFNNKTAKNSTVHVEACRMLAKPAVQAEIRRLQDERDKPRILTASQVLESLTKLAREALIGADRIRCLDLLGKYHKLFSDSSNTFIGEQKVLIAYSDPNTGLALPASPLRELESPKEGSSKVKDRKSRKAKDI